MNNENTTPEAIHDLFSRPIRPIFNWAEWLEHWQKATVIEEMLGLLHVGFNVPVNSRRKYGEKEYTEQDRLIFYFGLGDSWMSSFGLSGEEEDHSFQFDVGFDAHGNCISKTVQDLRQMVATKAFGSLYQNLFRAELQPRIDNDDRGDDAHRIYWENILITELFPVIMHFFRAEQPTNDRTDVRIRNLRLHRDEPSHQEKTALGFLLKMAQFLWRWEEVEIRTYMNATAQATVRSGNEHIRQKIDSAKPWMVEVLCEAGRLDILAKYWLKLDKVTIAKLKDIALRGELKAYKHFVKKDRRVRNLDEACFAGSEAAWFLKRHELLLQQYKFFSEAKCLEEEKLEVQEKLRQLTTSRR